MTYLTPSDYDRHGLDPTIPEALVAAASALIDAHCRRPSLLAAEYTERLRVHAGQRAIRLSHLPLIELTSVRVRYAAALADAVEAVQVFGLAGSWTDLPPASIETKPDTGELTLPMHSLGLAYTDIEVTYSAGFAVPPDAVKFACAQLVRNAQATPALNVRASQVSSLQMQYFAATLIDDTVRTLLAPFVAQKVA